MGMTNQQISWELSAIDRASAVFKNVENGMHGMEAAWSRFQALAVVSIGYEGMNKVAEATKDAEQASNRLQAVLRNTGATAGFTRNQLEGMADELAKSTQFDDKDIKKAEAEILIFGKIHGQTFKDALKLSTEVAAFWGTDLPSAARDVAKALSDPETAFKLLKSAGLSLGDQQKDQIKHMGALGDLAGQQAVIMNLLAKAYRGTAEEMNTGYTKAMGDAHKAWDEMLIGLGKNTVVRASTEEFFGSLTKSLKDVKSIIEEGDWLEKLRKTLAMQGTFSPMAGVGYLARLMAPNEKKSWWTPPPQTQAPAAATGLSDAEYAAQKLARSTAASMAQIGLSGQQVWISEAQKTLDLMHQNGLESEEKYYEERRVLIDRKLAAELKAIGAGETAQRAILDHFTTGPEAAAAQLALAKLGVERKAALSNARVEKAALPFQERAAKNALNQELFKSDETYMRAMDAELQKQIDLRQQATQANADYQSDMQFEIDLVGKSAVEQQKMNELRKIDLDLRTKIRAAAAATTDAGDGGNMTLFNETVDRLTKEANAEKAARLGILNYRIKLERDWVTGAKSAFNEYTDYATNAARATKDAFTNAFSNAENALTNFYETGKMGAAQFSSIVRHELAKIAAIETLGPFSQWLSMGAGALKGMLGPATQAPAPVSEIAWGGKQAAGGDYLVTKPTLFLAGEAGTERAMFSGANKAMGGTPNVTFIFKNETGQPIQAKQSGPMQFDGETWVGNAVLSLMDKNPSFRSAVRGS